MGKIADYTVYRLNQKEKTVCFAEGMAFNALIAALFYNSWIFLLPGMAVVYLYIREKKRVLARRRLHRMRTELQQFLSALIAALQTGRSIENAFAEAVKDLGNYAGTDTELTRELKSICAAVSVSEPLEKLVMELAYRSHLEELAYFGEVFSVGKKSGGNLVAVMRHTIRMLKERLEAEEEIYTVITQKRLEFYVMSVIPAAMIVYLRIGASGMMEQLYGNAVGALVMTVCLGIYGGCYLYGQRLLEIEN